MSHYVYIPFWEPQPEDSPRTLFFRAQFARALIRHNPLNSELLARIATTYMLRPEQEAWEVWAGLGWAPGLEYEHVLQLHRKKKFYIDIAVVNRTGCSHNLLLAYAHAPVEPTKYLADKNYDIRAIARRRLLLSEETTKRLRLLELKIEEDGSVGTISPEYLKELANCGDVEIMLAAIKYERHVSSWKYRFRRYVQALRKRIKDALRRLFL